MNIYLDLFLTFARIGGLTFGGGYAMLPMLQREVVEKRGWATEDELTDYYAIGQCTPGIIAVNTATFIGNKNKGILGGIVATLGVVFPSIVIITLMQVFASASVCSSSMLSESFGKKRWWIRAHLPSISWHCLPWFCLIFLLSSSYLAQVLSA